MDLFSIEDREPGSVRQVQAWEDHLASMSIEEVARGFVYVYRSKGATSGDAPVGVRIHRTEGDAGAKSVWAPRNFAAVRKSEEAQLELGRRRVE